MITIIIFSSNRIKYLSELITDIKKCNFKKKNRIMIVSYNETQSNIKKIKNITKESYFNHYIERQNLNYVERLKKYSKKVKTKFFWQMSDDDRIKFNSIEDINHILKKNNNLSGMTINHEPMLEIKKNIYKNKRSNLKIENFNIAKNAYQLGLNSAQIYNTKYFIQSIKFQKNIFNEAYYHTGVVLFLIATKKDWKYQKSKLIIYRYGVFNDKEKISYLKD